MGRTLVEDIMFVEGPHRDHSTGIGNHFEPQRYRDLMEWHLQPF